MHTLANGKGTIMGTTENNDLYIFKCYLVNLFNVRSSFKMNKLTPIFYY